MRNIPKVKSSESDVLKQYLKYLDTRTFFSKAEEKVIGTRIKKVEKNILTLCVKYQTFRRELKNLCVGVDRNITNAFKYSKLVNEDSPVDEIERIKNEFIALDKMVLTGTDRAVLLKLNKIKLTSSAINQILFPLKLKQTAITQINEKISNIFKFLGVKDDAEYSELAIKCQDSDFRKNLARKFYVSDEILIKKLYMMEDQKRELAEEDLTIEEIADLKELMSKVSKLERDYQNDRELLIKANLALVVSRVKKFHHTDVDIEDLIQEGNIGLMKAVDKYDPEKDVKITTYATWWIDQAIRRAVSNKSKLVRIPIHIQTYMKSLKQAYYSLSQKLGREPKISELAEHTQLKVELITELYTSAIHEVNLDSELETGVSYSEILFDENQQTPFAGASENILKDKVRVALANLDPRSEKILRLRFGIGEVKDHTLNEVGTQFNLTRESIRQIESKSLKKLEKSGDLKTPDIKQKIKVDRKKQL